MPQHERIRDPEGIDIDKIKKSYTEINIKNLPYHFLHDMINIKNLDPSLLRINKISLKVLMLLLTTLAILQIKRLDYGNIKSKTALIFNNVDVYIECNSIEESSGEPIEYKKDFLKIRFESDDDFSLDKILSIPSMICLSKMQQILSTGLFTRMLL